MLAEYGGRGLTNKYRNSPILLLKTVYPEFNWDATRFHYTPKGTYKDQSQLRRCFDRFKVKLRISQPSDWYTIHNREVFNQPNGSGVLHRFGNSLYKALRAAYPEEDFLPWKFQYSPGKIWRDEEVMGKFIKWAEERLKINTRQDWYRISIQQLGLIGGKKISSSTLYLLTR
eukprot:TRINITY_DN5116_c1_g1_i3.p1 TRINITY_DN5116_c1_g1~~TRINITY_DN5116_c1_g1_i3.p1  ORF type:complete len:172 (-),score=19.14 TRINITY_DN5116_c1_g1_i3:629-1144(-)